LWNDHPCIRILNEGVVQIGEAHKIHVEQKWNKRKKLLIAHIYFDPSRYFSVNVTRDGWLQDDFKGH